MTGPEKQTLDLALTELREFRREANDKFDNLDVRLRAVEVSRSSDVAFAAGSAAATTASQLQKKDRALSTRAWAGLVVAAVSASVGATAVVLKIIELIT